MKDNVEKSLMTTQEETLVHFWDRAYQEKGHTGYSDPLLHRYDQPVRIATVGRILSKLFPKGDLTGCTALDIGCGTGDFIDLLRSRGATVTGMDISPCVIEGARQRFSNDDKVKLLCSPVGRACLINESFDLITSVTVLQHIINYDELIGCLRTFCGLLKPNGRIILLEIAPPFAEAVTSVSCGIHYLKERPPHAWREAFASAGLAILDEVAMPQLGIAALRGLNNFLTATQRFIGVTPVNQKNQEYSHVNTSGLQPSQMRRVKRACFHAFRRALLIFTWPFDHYLALSLPPERFRHYRVFILRPSL